MITFKKMVKQFTVMRKRNSQISPKNELNEWTNKQKYMLDGFHLLIVRAYWENQFFHILSKTPIVGAHWDADYPINIMF